MAYPHFKLYGKDQLTQYIKNRRFETRIGERVEVVRNPKDINASLLDTAAEYVIIGIPEDLGVIANLGIAGTSSLWPAFLSAFLNMQNNDFLCGEEVLLLGNFDFSQLKEVIETHAHNPLERTDAYRHAVNTIDQEVEALIKLVVTNNKMPVVIGGGHNNAYPIIKAASKGLHKSGHSTIASINCINLDAHTDFRPLEGRHSGNPFRYAMEEAFLRRYAVVCAHENYIPQNVYADIKENDLIQLTTYEEIFIREKITFTDAVKQATAFTSSTFTGIELDLDVVQQALSSAMSPVGISPAQARQYIHITAAASKPAYLHICEGAVKLEDGRKDETTGKLVACLVSDFITRSA